MILDNRSLPDRISVGERAWEAGEAPAQALYEEVWALLQSLSEPDRETALAGLRSQLGTDEVEAAGSLTDAELLELADGGLVEIGAHTRTHPVLSRLSGAAAEAEILGSKRSLEEALGRPVREFSYPFGGTEHYGPREVDLVRAAGFELACSAMAGLASDDADRLQLPRLTIGNWSTDELARAIQRVTG
jgi:peptidoglycan/xylan/chitin deacetylase (PgdA/CDA1 family)